MQSELCLKIIKMLNPGQAFQKRTFDVVFSFFGLVVFSLLILMAWLLASIDARSNGFFFQKRVGLNGKIFKVVKIKTMSQVAGIETMVTRRGDPRITSMGAFFRRTKLDELPSYGMYWLVK